MPIILLHLQSHWSPVDGVCSFHELVTHAQEMGLPAPVLTDSNALYGARGAIGATLPIALCA